MPAKSSTLFGRGMCAALGALALTAMIATVGTATAKGTDPNSPRGATPPGGALCPAGKPAIQLTITAFRTQTGTLRVRLYGGREDQWLADGARLTYFELKVPRNGPARVCIPVPAPGNYAIAIHHDVQDNRDKDMDDGAGYSRNPSLNLLRLKPDFSEVVFGVGRAPKPITIQMYYRFGLFVRPGNAS